MRSANILTAALATAAMAGGCAPAPAMIVSPPRYTAARPEPEQVVTGANIPAGTQLTVRLNQPVGTRFSWPGQRFSATLVTPVVDAEGNSILPAGSEVLGYVHGMQTGNGAGRPPVLSLGFDAVRVAGRVRPLPAHVVSADVIAQQAGAHPGAVGGGAVGGALLGGIFGGWTGALIGTAAGGAVGAGASYLAAPRDLSVPQGGRIIVATDTPVPVAPLRRAVAAGAGGGPLY